MDWRIYYDDGSTYSSNEGEPENAPAFGIICIVYADALVGRKIMHQFDWYYWIEEKKQWWGSDIYGLLDRLLHNLSTRAVKQGRSVDNDTYRTIMALADKNDEFPHKSGILVDERPK